MPASQSFTDKLFKGDKTPTWSHALARCPHLSLAPDEPKPGTVVGLRWFLICVAIFSANLLYGLDTTIGADIQGAVSDTFDNVMQLDWLGVGFNLGSTVAILPLGKAYGIFDTKWLYIACLTMSSAGSALCGAAPTMNAISWDECGLALAARACILEYRTLNLVSSTLNPRQASFYMGFIGFVYGGGCILGPIVGGLLADSAATWRWAFYLNLVIFGAMSPIYLLVLPSFPRQVGRTFTQKMSSLDWLGIVLSAAMYVCFILAFAFGGVPWEWSDARTIALIVLSDVFLVAFAVSQHYALFTTQLNRLFPCDLLRDVRLVLLYICMACGGAALFVSVYYIPLYYLFVHGDTGVEAATRLLPFICVYVAAILMAGYAMPPGFLIAGGAAMLTVDVTTSSARVYGFSVLIAVGLTVCQAGYAIATRLAKPGREPKAIQFLNISQGQSQLLGLAIANSIFQSTAFSGIKSILDEIGFTDAEIQTAIAGAKSAVLQQVGPELRQECIEVIVRAVRYEWVLVVVAGVLQTTCSCFLPRKF
ncbi:uncharacterized protein NECHADRAFT_98378 [Fusarium vanettenii 77-13-4]|uniref:Major facilitator superfamily (MFS) profile domain-containing protein n=1 Tax=Fusarium vanettenii (strain ATCC MYA-4622 / CBS 123669 / FGSC 9596 / NRRL 45880 / 77-13-4) TaxID=660122 RepID=C7ZQN3_FUSV7|nr:uncharacterized protein NECHADRAFT_98378 [Fusarium vanettenii 77-13-4]EEU33676.1 hypothetical protein NECHADRAFT_98378 [Fusarium vanettenii 77-13-4]